MFTVSPHACMLQFYNAASYVETLRNGKNQALTKSLKRLNGLSTFIVNITISIYKNTLYDHMFKTINSDQYAKNDR